jgi:hypothetical protein
MPVSLRRAVALERCFDTTSRAARLPAAGDEIAIAGAGSARKQFERLSLPVMRRRSSAAVHCRRHPGVECHNVIMQLANHIFSARHYWKKKTSKRKNSPP